MSATDDFMAKYFKQRKDGTFEMPPLLEPDPDKIQAIGKYFMELEIEEKLARQETDQMRFVG